jgi:hypothetical protein
MSNDRRSDRQIHDLFWQVQFEIIREVSHDNAVLRAEAAAEVLASRAIRPSDDPKSDYYAIGNALEMRQFRLSEHRRETRRALRAHAALHSTPLSVSARPRLVPLAPREQGQAGKH